MLAQKERVHNAALQRAGTVMCIFTRAMLQSIAMFLSWCCVRPSVHVSHAGIVLKRLKLGSRGCHCSISYSSFQKGKHRAEIQRGSPPTNLPYISSNLSSHLICSNNNEWGHYFFANSRLWCAISQKEVLQRYESILVNSQRCGPFSQLTRLGLVSTSM